MSQAAFGPASGDIEYAAVRRSPYPPHGDRRRPTRRAVSAGLPNGSNRTSPAETPVGWRGCIGGGTTPTNTPVQSDQPFRGLFSPGNPISDRHAGV
jgi:hypothetical protein